MKIKKFISVACAMTLSAALLSACGGDGGSDAEAADNTVTEEVHDMNTETSYKATEENVKLLGRTYFNEDKLYCALSGTGVEFTFTGTKCSVTVMGDSNSGSPTNADNQARVGINEPNSPGRYGFFGEAFRVADVYDSYKRYQGNGQCYFTHAKKGYAYRIYRRLHYLRLRRGRPC